MSDEIPPIPDPPARLREASSRGEVVPFIGAGASVLAGCPSWKDFADRALTFFVSNAKLTYSQLDQLAGLNPRIKLTIAKGLEQDHTLQIEYRALLQATGRDNPKGRRLYAAISQLATTFVTTNYDEWLDAVDPPPPSIALAGNPATPAPIPPRNPIHRIDQFTPDQLNVAGNVIHLHGSLAHPGGMILTTQDYVRHYRNDRASTGADENPVLTFLEYLFSNRTVLFIGYGLEELEILEYVISKARQQQQEKRLKEVRHYLLQGFYSHEVELMRALRRYYAECGIELIPFLRDQKGWDQLIDVLERFARVMPAKPIMKSAMLLEQENLLNG